MHTQARRFAERGYQVVLIGHAGHEEVEGTTGEAPDAIVLVESVADAEQLELSADKPIGYITQTTLSVDETNAIIKVLRRRFPRIEGPAKEDICYATSNRQWAVKELLDEVDVLLVVGSRNSSNSLRLVEVAHAAHVPAHLVDDASEIDEGWLADARVVGVTSAPPRRNGSCAACATGSARAASRTSASSGRRSRMSCSGCRSSCAGPSAPPPRPSRWTLLRRRRRESRPRAPRP